MGVSARALATIAALTSVIALSACSSDEKPKWTGNDGGAGGPSASASAELPQATFAAPADGATNISTAAELALQTSPGANATVTLTDASGGTVQGGFRTDGATWVPATQLKYGTQYTASVTSAGDTAGKKITFTTMAKPGKTVNVSTALSDNKTYGVAVPVVVRFGSSVPQELRASVEKRLLVNSDPPQVGTWYWFNGGEVHYRPKEYWQSGTKVTVRLATGGLQLTKTGFGSKDVTLHFTIGDKIIMITDDKTHQMTVEKNGEVVKTIPVSLGKAKTPSSSGNMVIMDKQQSELFVSTDPSDPYRETVYWTQRMTSGGEYIHSAPWSVGDQGKRNVSHGCTNVSEANAKFLFNLTKIGDVHIVKGTPRKLAWGNGWTDWDKSWAEYVKGSALPPPAETAVADPGASASASPSVATSPSA
ncbi:Ig-like domain-containing protein [Dactylosporangium sucinum]|uniref:Conserved lipoprotein LppS n=1 Tax=Dactylosporangium sucinum TaxID=1424081 RepID=A0A917UBR9_9ACTN|nr:Ig-like domain-containing protein [Dactylosporangium sucinum]GGM66808.1 putative conserved lipoprotein LppS [Dactylosporangium sucinum]